MGRIFEKRKHKMFARYDKMAKTFTRIGKEIAIAVKQAGPLPESNPRLRLAIQNAKASNMPKDRVEAAIKRASSKEEGDFEEVVFEGYGPFGVAILVECATNNNTRTVANIRMYFNRANGSLGKSGSVDYLFERKSVFEINPAGQDLEELEFKLIDFGCEEIGADEDKTFVYSSFENFGNMLKGLEDNQIEVISTALDRIPTTTVTLNKEQEEEIIELINKIEEDDDVQHVFHNMV